MPGPDGTAHQVEGNMNKCLLVFAILLLTLSVPALGLTRTDLQGLETAGQCVKSKNYNEAYTHFKRMGDHGCPFSNCLLGIMFQKGNGVNKSIPKALAYYRKSANKGFRDAELRLGRLYDEGEEGLQRNARAAGLWFQRAAQHGAAEAQFKLGKMYLTGDGVKEESLKAKIWLRKAADQGVSEASQLLSGIPGEAEAAKEAKDAKDVFTRSGSNYEAGWNNLEKSWQGYADVAKALESSTAAAK